MENIIFSYGEDNILFLLLCLFHDWYCYHSVYVEAVCSKFMF
jgi:hypothetical protein